LLLEAGAEISPAVKGKFHAIHLAARNGRLDMIKQFIEHDPEVIHLRDHCNQTPLLWAASRGHHVIVAFLLDQGADVNTATQGVNNENNNNSPLDWAIQGGHSATISILFKSGAIANHLHSIVSILKKNKGKTLDDMIEEGDLNEVQKVIKHNNSFLNQIDKDGYTLLQYAALCGQIKIVHYLVAEGAELNIPSPVATGKYKDIQYPDMTALDIVLALQKHDRVALLLLDAGAMISPTVKGKFHAIHLAAKNGRLDIIKKLVTREPELVHLRDGCNQTPLLWAAFGGYPDIVEFCLAQGADVNRATIANGGENHNNSPLDWAIKEDHFATISTLINAGAIANNNAQYKNKPILKNKHTFFSSSNPTKKRRLSSDIASESVNTAFGSNNP